ncbi:leukocyte immunoglobulin-like receptor subfamily B member 3 [Hoplias malabaricus]|uniref:leukocyte immunoglobulin-like receptor subfamily B member 3 n=1 Tax=Hoplias malabaricus TaxID=27720 RepID=UPI0034631A7F
MVLPWPCCPGAPLGPINVHPTAPCCIDQQEDVMAPVLVPPVGVVPHIVLPSGPKLHILDTPLSDGGPCPSTCHYHAPCPMMRPRPTVKVQPAARVFIKERVTLTCEINSGVDGKYVWYKNNAEVQNSQKKEYVISSVDGSRAGVYTCKGARSSGQIYTETSNSVSLSVSVKPQPTLTSSHNGSVLRGNPVTLYCTLGQSAGWTFYWSRDTQSPEIRTSSSIYTISSVSDSNGGQYMCRAGRGDPVYYTYYSDALWVNVTDNPTAVVSSIKPDVHVFKGENITLRCDTEAGGDTEWNYIWFKDNNELKQFSRSQEITVRSVTESNSGKYTCRGERKSDSQKSEISDAVTLTVSGEAQAVLSVSPQSWLTEGDSVTLSCEVNIFSKGWTFSWYRAVPYRQGLTQITDVHGKVVYSVELLSDSRRGAGGSYTLSPAALYHTGVYVCGAERGEPAFHTQYSNPQPLWITGNSPPVSLIISPSRTQHFSTDSLSLSCERHRDSAGWRVRRYTHSEKVSNCSSVPGFTCNISSLSTSDTGVYWCQSESGERSDPVNITVHNGDVILESPVHSVSEGYSLTLRCLYHSTKSSHLPTDFYKDGVLLQKQTTGEMTIHKVSKSHEGLYHCKHPEEGESPRSWISVRSSGSGLDGVITGVAVGLSVSLLLIIILGLFCYYKKNKASLFTFFGNQWNTNQSLNLWGAAHCLSGSSPLQTDDSAALSSEIVYANIVTSEKKKPKQNEDAVITSDVTYSEIKEESPKPHGKETRAEPSDVTYADIELKPKKELKGEFERKYLNMLRAEVCCMAGHLCELN